MRVFLVLYSVLLSTGFAFSQCNDYRETVDKSFASIEEANTNIDKSGSIIGKIAKVGAFDQTKVLVTEAKQYVDDVMTNISNVEAYALYVESLSEECGCKEFIEPAGKIQETAESINETVSQLFNSLDFASKSKDAAEFSRYYDDIVKYIKLSDASIEAMYTESKSLIDLCK